MNRSQILAEINHERERQIKKWGKQSHDNPYWTAILTEEVGEAAKEVCDYTHSLETHPRALPYACIEYRTLIKIKLKQELIQVAAVCVAWLEQLEAENGR